MNTDTGHIYPLFKVEQIKGELAEKQRKKFKEMQIPPTQAQLRRRPPRVGRNEPCPCGSGKKFKKCCYTGGTSRRGE